MPAPTLSRLPWYHGSQSQRLIEVDRAFYPPGFRFPRHVHDYAEFFLVDRGEGVHVVGSSAAPVAPGELVFIHPDCAHALEARERALSFINISIPFSLFRDLERRLGGSPSWIWRREPQAVRLEAYAQGRLEERIAEIEHPENGADRLQVEAFLGEALWLATAARRRRTAMPAALAQVVRELADPEHLRAGVSGMAARAHWSREHLNRQMRRYLGETAVGVLTRIRLEHAARLLRHSDLPVLEICQRCGLDNLSHFYRLFRTRFGCPPGAWRQRTGPGAA